MNEDLTWRKSSHSGGQNNDCVEVALDVDGAHLRDSKAPTSGAFTLSRHAWSALLTAARNQHVPTLEV
jgi:hypothetical protein